jgi:hypothetical protein
MVFEKKVLRIFGRKTEGKTEERMISFIICALRQILLERSIHGE